MPHKISTVRGRELGAGVQAVISSAGLSSREVADMLGWQESKISNLTTGKGGTTQVELALLLGRCRAAPAEVAHLMALYPTQHQSGWWQQHGVCRPIRLRTAVANLTWAKTLISWNPLMLPILLQTADYLREVLRASATLPVGELEERVRANLALQRALPLSTRRTFYLHEPALRLPVGGHEVHRRQLQHLVTVANRPTTTIRIVPTAHGAHAGMAGAFTQLTFDRYEPLVMVDTENSSLFAEEKDAITGYGKVIRALEKASLASDESKQLITELSQDVRA